MKIIEHPEIESAFFEFRKMKAFLDNGVYIYVPTVHLAPIDVAQRYVHSQLLIDLISVFDQSIEYFFKRLKLKQVRGKSPFDILRDEGQIVSPQYFKWYKDLRNESAHQFKRHDTHFLEQATEHIANQLEHWNIFTATLNFAKLFDMHEDGPSYIGARVDNQVILSYRTMKHVAPVGFSASAGMEVNLSFNDFIQLPEKWSRRIIYSRAS